MRRFAALLVLPLMLAGCTRVADDLKRAERAFTEARYEDVEAWAVELAPDVPSMEAELRAKYYYLTGLSAFRIGKRSRARHALALCREEVALGKVRLPELWTRNLTAALEELSPPPREAPPFHPVR